MFYISKMKSIVALIVVFTFLVSIAPFAIADVDLSMVINNVINRILKNEELTEWEVIGISRAGMQVPESYYKNLSEYVKERGGNFHKVTDYAKIAMTAAAIERDPVNIAGYNFIEKIYENDRMTLQGCNGPIFALIALDACKASIPDNAKWSREKLLDLILKHQKSNGGFSLTEDTEADIDITAMALQALSVYKERNSIKQAIENALGFLSRKQQDDGGYYAWGGENSESISQTIIALTALGIDPDKDSRFIKNSSLVSKLLTFIESDGGFSHIKGEGSNDMATEQALLALIAYRRFLDGDYWVYDMSEPIQFSDILISSDWARPYIQKASKYGLMKGKGQNKFQPKQNITRAELATLLVRLLKESPESNIISVFEDVKPDDWYCGYIMKAYERDIIKGKGSNKFNPEDYITREEMATMLQRGLDLEIPEDLVVSDIQQASDWAIPAIKSVMGNRLMIGNSGVFMPKQRVTREMAAAVIVRVFEKLNNRKEKGIANF